jgi:hypothetical protein
VVAVAAVALGGQHALEEVLRLVEELGAGVHAPARLRDEAGDRVAHHPQRALGRAVRRRLDVAPVRERRRDPAADQRQYARDVALQLAVALERVEVVAERERGRDVGRERHERPQQVERLAGAGRAGETPVQPLRRHADHLVEAVEVVRVQCAHRELALAPPVLALGGEDAVDADLVEHLLELAPAPVAVGPLAQHRVDRLGPGEHDDRAPAEPHAVRGAVAARPFLEHEMQALGPQLQRVAGSRQAARGRQVGDGRGRGRVGQGSGHAADRSQRGGPGQSGTDP